MPQFTDTPSSSGPSPAVKVVVLAVMVAVTVAAVVLVRRGLEDQGSHSKRVYGDQRVAEEGTVAWRERVDAAVPVPVADAWSLAVTGDGALVVGGGDGAVCLGRDGSIRWRMASDEAVRSISVDPADGAVYVALVSRVRVLEADGTVRATWPVLREPANLTAIAVAPDAVYVGDDGAHDRGGVVWRCRRDGEILGRFGTAAEGHPGLKVSSVIPRPFMDLAWDPTQNELVVSNMGRYRVDRFTADGRPSGHFGHPAGRNALTDVAGFAGCCNPIALAVMADGAVVTSEKGMDYARIKIFEPDGSLRHVVAPPRLFDFRKFGAVDLAVDRAGRVLALDRDRAAVRVFVPEEGSGS